MKNFGGWYALAALGVLLGKEFVDWVWWYNWEDDNEENPARLLSATWRIWCKLQDAYSWLWSRFWRHPERWLTEIWRRFFPTDPYCEPMDQDGRTPTEWVLIGVIGVWDMPHWYKDEYDWEVKANWDDFLKTRDAAEHPEAERQHMG